MTPTLRGFLWLALVMIAGAGGYLFGFARGNALGTANVAEMSRHNNISDRVVELRRALVALEHNDLEHSRAVHEATVRGALVALGNLGPTFGQQDCSNAARRVMADARLYVTLHPPPDDDPLAPLVRQGAEFCP